MHLSSNSTQPPRAEKPPDPARETLCRRCGRCCYEKFVVDGHVFTTSRPCQFLDVKTHLCRVYERRFELNPHCLTVEQGIELGVFPADCPYVRGLENYLPAEDGWLDDELARRIENGQLFRYEDIIAEMRRSHSKREN